MLMPQAVESRLRPPVHILRTVFFSQPCVSRLRGKTALVLRAEHYLVLALKVFGLRTARGQQQGGKDENASHAGWITLNRGVGKL